MSLLSVPVIGDTVAGVLSALSTLAPKPRREFADLPVTTDLVTVPTRHGGVRCTIYHPAGDDAARSAVYVNAHGGGFVIRHPEQDDPWCRYLATQAGVTVVNVDYATAPRHRFPVAAEQVFDVITWAAQAERDWDGNRLCVGGQSAGGSLSAAAARLALETGGPRIALQLLHYPVLDLVTDPKDKPAPVGAGVLLRWMGEVFNVAYVPDLAQRRDRLVSPAWGTNAEGIEGIAPALVVTAERDRLRAEAADYAASLDKAGSLVELRDVRGVDHGYDTRTESPELTREMYEFMAGHVRRATQAPERHA